MTPPPDLSQLIAHVRVEAPDEDPLGLLALAVQTRDELTDVAELLLDHFVEIARDAGCSWAQIGDALGVSKQAAQQRSAAPISVLRRLLGRLRDPGMFGRLDVTTRRCIMSARHIAIELGHHHLGTQHLLLGLLAVPGTAAATTLTAAGITEERVRAAVSKHVGEQAPASARGQFTPRAKKVVELSLRESLRDHSARIGPEHLLRGLLRESGGLGFQILRELGTDVDTLRRDLAHHLDPEP